jgi:hypothetical protein
MSIGKDSPEGNEPAIDCVYRINDADGSRFVRECGVKGPCIKKCPAYISPRPTIDLTADQARAFLGQWIEVDWNGGSMGGLLAKVDDGWLVVDYGFGVLLAEVTRFSVTAKPPDNSCIG